MSLPSDRGSVTTEARHPASESFDTLDVGAAARLLIDDHADVPRALAAAEPALSAFISALVPRLAAGGRLVYFGAGTSGRLGVLDASECPPTFRTPPELVVGLIAGGDAALRRSSEGREDDPRGAAPAFDALVLDGADTVVGIAAGGTTPYVLGGLECAGDRGALTAFITCSPVDPATAAHVIHLPTGPEVLTGSTRLKAGSATKLALNIITTVAFTQLGKVHGNLMIDLRATNDKLRDRAIRILREFAPHLARNEAAAVLDAADRRLPVAIVMAVCEVNEAEAQRRWEDARTLREALAEGARCARKE